MTQYSKDQKPSTKPNVAANKISRLPAAAADDWRMGAEAWASEMYDFCGGDGEGNAYLGDGISISPDGRLVDD